MPRNQFQRMVFAFLTVVITVHAYVFYSLYVVNGKMFMQLTGESGVLAALHMMGGVPMFGRMVPIWAVILIEFAYAYFLEVTVGSPLSFKLACRKFDPAKNHPVIFESVIINATVGVMCPAMSLLAAFFYWPWGIQPFNFWAFAASYIRLVCFNFPFAFFTQMYFIQPAVRAMFRVIFAKDIAEREQQPRVRPKDESEAIADIYRRMDEIKHELNKVSMKQ